jgi:prevent-host-death family protein
MKSPLKTVGSFEAKTHLAELLRKVSAGQTIRITQRGKPIADLMPIQTDELNQSVAAAHKMLVFMANVKVQGNVDIKSLINAGRD